MAASDVSICSNALLMLGAQPISSLDESNDRARLASNLYESVRNDVLRSHPWNCCIKRVALAPDTDTPAFDWDYQYTLPGDYLRLLAVGEAGSEIPFKIESGKLLCDDNPAYLRYVARNEVPATWDDMLVHAMTLQMAAKMAYAITQSATLRDSVAGEYERHMKVARAVDGQDDTPETLGDSPLLNARFGGSNWSGR